MSLPMKRLRSSRISRTSAKFSGAPSPFGCHARMSASESCTEQRLTSGRRIPPTETYRAAALSFSPPHSEQSRSVIQLMSRPRVRSDVVSVYVFCSRAMMPSQGRFILYTEPLSDSKWKLITVDPEPLRRMSLSSSLRSSNGVLREIP